MDVKTITELIQTVGFPVFCVLGMGIFIFKLWQQSVVRENKLYLQLDECRKINSKAIDTISKYSERLDVIQDDVREIKQDVIALMKK